MSDDRYSRQSFLGPEAEDSIAGCTLGIVGLGGGGSHIIQQLAHIGFQRFVLYDNDVVEESNLNRLVGATLVDARAETPKIQIAKRMIFGLQPDARVEAFPDRWQMSPEALRRCQIVFGCVDSFKGREELEIFCRRYLIHYIDVGMDVHGKDNPVIGGQVMLSSPGGLCLRCMGFLTEARLAEEGRRYGDAGGRPQVVWPNGILASTAVGLAVDLVTNWTKRPLPHAYFTYDGNLSTIVPSPMLRHRTTEICPHFCESDIGEPRITAL